MSAPEINQTAYGDGNIFTATGNINITYNLPPADANERRNLLVLLDRMEHYWVEGVLQNSLQGVVLLELDKKSVGEAVGLPWEQTLEFPDQSNQTLPPDAKIGHVFQQLGRALLILGEAGSGKTITLLELAKDLLERAKDDPIQPIPVVLNLSTWIDNHQSIISWLVNELKTKYFVSSKMSDSWLRENRLSLLLDGLDEVKPEKRSACVEGINRFIAEVGVPGLAVCSRFTEYTDMPVRLNLAGAICLQPLSPERVSAYLSSAGSKLAALNSAIKEDSTLQSLAQTPLLLSVMSLAYQDVPLDALTDEKLDTVEAYRIHLFGMYIDRMFGRKAKAGQVFSREATESWLSWLAREMRRHSQSIFFGRTAAAQLAIH